MSTPHPDEREALAVEAKRLADAYAASAWSDGASGSEDFSTPTTKLELSLFDAIDRLARLAVQQEQALGGDAVSAVAPPGGDLSTVPGWQPIETAPQDGYVLVHEDTAMRALLRIAGVWHKTGYPAIIYPPWNDVLVGDDAKRVLPPGCRLEVRDGCCENPTHWMPLPEPPPREGSLPDRAETGTGSVATAIEPGPQDAPKDGAAEQRVAALEADAAELRFYREHGFPYVDWSVLFAEPREGDWAIKLPLSYPHPDGEGSCTAVILHAFTVPQLYEKAKAHIAALDAALSPRQPEPGTGA